MDLYNKIPSDTEILMTHYPPFGILDGAYAGVNRPKFRLGCRKLYKEVTERIKP